MNLQEKVKQSVKILKLVSEGTIDVLRTLGLKESKLISFDDADVYDQFKFLVKEGFLAKDYRHYTLTEKGQSLIESFDYRKEEPKKYERLLEEVDADAKFVEVTYKRHSLKENTIGRVTERFELVSDGGLSEGIPMFVVNEETYSNLINRMRGQHWRQYLPEGACRLIKEKKLQRFYIQDESTGRQYLYFMPPAI